MLPEQPDRLAVGLGTATFANERQRLLVGILHAEQPADDAGLAVEMQDIGVAHDIVGAGRADDQHRHILGDHGVEKGAPGLLR